MSMLDQTPLARNIIFILLSFITYVYLGLLSYHVLTSILLLSISLAFGYTQSLQKDEDLDVMGAMVINGRGFFNPPGTQKPPQTINSIAYLETPLSWEDTLRPHLISKLFDYRRFNSIGCIHPKQSRKVWNTHWIKCNLYDPNIQNRMLTKEIVSNIDELRIKIDQLCNEQLDPFLPQWRFHYIENNNGPSGCLWRVSHGCADGLRLVAFLSELCQDINGNPMETPMIGKLGPQSSGASITSLTQNYKFEGLNYDQAKIFYENGFSRKSVKKGKMEKNDDNKNKNKNKSKKKKRRGFGLGKMLKLFNPMSILKDLKSVNDMLSGPFDTISPFKPDYTVHCPKVQTIVRPRMMKSEVDGEMRDWLELEWVKKIKNYYKVSVNDVLTALFAGGVRRYIMTMDEKYFENQDMNKYRTNAMVAFGFPPSEPFVRQYDWLKNGFTFVSWPIPVEIESFINRVKRCNKNGNKKKQSLEAPMALAISTFGCRLGLDYIIEDGTTGAFKRHSCVFSNVPGPSQTMYLCKSKVVRVEASYNNVIPQILCLSTGGKIYITLTCDLKRFPNADIICNNMIEECQTEYKNILSMEQS